MFDRFRLREHSLAKNHFIVDLNHPFWLLRFEILNNLDRVRLMHKIATAKSKREKSLLLKAAAHQIRRDALDPGLAQADARRLEKHAVSLYPIR